MFVLFKVVRCILEKMLKIYFILSRMAKYLKKKPKISYFNLLVQDFAKRTLRKIKD